MCGLGCEVEYLHQALLDLEQFTWYVLTPVVTAPRTANHFRVHGKSGRITRPETYQDWITASLAVTVSREQSVFSHRSIITLSLFLRSHRTYSSTSVFFGANSQA